MRKQNKEIQANCINDQKASPSITSKLNLNLLKYETHIINRMNENNGLFILAQGLSNTYCLYIYIYILYIRDIRLYTGIFTPVCRRKRGFCTYLFVRFH